MSDNTHPKNITIITSFINAQCRRDNISRPLRIVENRVDVGEDILNRVINSVKNAATIIKTLHAFGYSFKFHIYDEYTRRYEEGYFTFGTFEDIIIGNTNVGWSVFEGEDKNDMICSNDSLFYTLTDYRTSLEQSY